MTTATSDVGPRKIPFVPVDIVGAKESLEKSLEDVSVLLSFHEKAEQPTKGRPSKDHSTLKRAAIVLLYAGWESFFENVIEAVAHAYAAHNKLAPLPEPLQMVILRDIQRLANAKADSKERRTTADILASVTEYDWPARLRELAHDELYGRNDADRATYGVNTADAKNVSLLLTKYCGTNLLDKVVWAGMSNRQVIAKLDKLVELRGSIAHTGQLPDEASLPLSAVRMYAEFIEKVAAKLVEQIAGTLPGRTPSVAQS